MQTQLCDYGYTFNKIPILCDNKSAIAISENPVQHSKTKHTDISYHFLKHHVEEGNVEMYFVNTEYQLADLFTKALDEKRFTFLIENIGMTGKTSRRRKKPAVDQKGKSTEHYDHQSGVMSFKFTALIIRLQVKQLMKSNVNYN
ncbi:hypothetical protein OSB04_007171 [Centaurea solstitialis]|uniref:Retrotransposon protein, putative, unclassified n=1 Tax=Centaurea solstitialis TaxID=347529 RepID=A0AA38WT50_9ASTR|nr:hypothetical protein OSB04_007171 [Centaurea solstitialis]